ncbi:F-Box protein [Musa troglodytarum]|uniref:F-Box protein n=1 Tax=Musa troglodytarum TaxID=320322 RepID=A0A9E7JLC2_9LILI|nr:F-Box protein [Musa troglodytarum]
MGGVSLTRDFTTDLPDECLALVFQSLRSGDRKSCSLVCRRWLAALALVAARFPGLVSLKLRACRALTVAGMEAIARHCPGLRELSVSSCTFGARGIDVVLRGCPLLEDLSIKRLRGLHDPSATADLVAGAASLRSLCLEDLYNGQCFAPFIAGSPNLKTLKLIRCSGDWDPLLQDIAARVPWIVEIHLERLQVTGLQAVAQRCAGIRELVLAGLNPTYRSLELIASNCGCLERLALCGSETIGDAEVACIASKCTSLKKLCIKECPVSDQGMEALAAGCPKLVKMTVKRCSGVTPECADRLVASRHGMLAVNLEVNDGSTNDQQQEATEEGSAFEEFGVAAAIGGSELPRPLVDGVGSKGRWPGKKKRAGFFATRRNLVASALRRWSHGSSNSSHSRT